MVAPTKRVDEPAAVDDDNCFSRGKIPTADFPLLPMLPCEQFYFTSRSDFILMSGHGVETVHVLALSSRLSASSS